MKRPKLKNAGAALLLGGGCLLAPLGVPRADPEPQEKPPPQVRPRDRLRRTPSSQADTLSSRHFEALYDPRKLPKERAEEALREAEAGWDRCLRLFGSFPGGGEREDGRPVIRLDLTPNFRGATGFAMPSDPQSADPKKRPLIGVRYADLDYLGLTGEYVLTHEIAHVFSGKLAGTALGEGIADWATGEFSGLPMRPWWGRALREAGLWIEPEAFFITGDFQANPEVTAVIRTAQYAESALLVQFLVQRFGWAKVRDFAADYGRARGRLASNEDRKRLPAPGRRQDGQRDPRLPPDPAEVRANFERHFGETWTTLSSEWRAAMESDPAPPGGVKRLVTGHRIYGAIRNWEMWALAQRPAPPEAAQERVRAAFTEANRLLRGGDASGATRALEQALALVDALRRPRAIALAGQRGATRRSPRVSNSWVVTAQARA